MKTVYEDEGFISFTKGVLRPGGIELTCSLVKAANLALEENILDVCCGMGESVAALALLGYNIEGVDISPKLIEKGRALGRKINPGNAYELKGQYKALLYECALSLLQDKPRALKAAAKALPRGGLILLSDLYPKRESAAPRLNCDTCLNGILPFKRLNDFMEAAGFSLIYFKDQSNVYRNFLSMLIMEYGSLEVFFKQFIEDCQEYSPQLKGNVKLGYFESIWEKN